jgi:uncharacterized membrane protein YbaN (DUF454 family)
MISRWFLVSLGVLATTLGLAAACFVRSSDRMYGWLTSNRLFGSFIQNYREQRGVSARAKLVALALLWGVIGYTFLTAVNAAWLRVLLLSVAIGVTFHLLRLKTLPKSTSGRSGTPG